MDSPDAATTRYVGGHLHWVDGNCLTRAEWDRAWNCLVDVMLYGDPLSGAPDAAQQLAEELVKGPFGEVMALAAA